MLLVSPVVEELFFRSGIQQALETGAWLRNARARKHWALLITSGLFALAHAWQSQSWLGLATFAPSLVLGMAWRMGGLGWAAAAHAWFNLALLRSG
ncbi:MAG: hypothetical protein GAK30_03685 [Paracidovorax wautersii]|uniref:CAAX prenyl protease 2/Lysostaphin resistance protein A-like domain-containing protein n=1 Tax=Paracidovorax wautersii TaxID=1177982 RepID=A0A7V8FKT3_9BURK|nr:MAG: hypothetical protein GAK30_03685 [Paracidovorax wautersii]